jgi:potassium-transporting ATPase KdpC subunit
MKPIKTGILIFAMLWIVVGILYPLLITTISQVAFPGQAAGSLIYAEDGNLSGSYLIGQPFSDPKYFWPRPSATSGFPYNPLASGGSNLGPTNPELLKQISDRQAVLRISGLNGSIPSDLVMASASGLDPHISLEAALAQIPRVAKARKLDENVLKALVSDNVENKLIILSDVQYINILRLNLALDTLETKLNGR